jgi:hypothetical protein
MTKPIIWVHGDCLSPYNPAFVAHPDAPAIFVFDDALLTQWNISLKRITFIYECLLELPVTICRGHVAEQVLAFANEHDATQIITTESVSPRFRQLCSQMQQLVPLEILPATPFIQYTGKLDLKRFSRYWQAIEPLAFGQPRMFG